MASSRPSSRVLGFLIGSFQTLLAQSVPRRGLELGFLIGSFQTHGFNELGGLLAGLGFLIGSFQTAKAPSSAQGSHPLLILVVKNLHSRKRERLLYKARMANLRMMCQPPGFLSEPGVGVKV